MDWSAEAPQGRVFVLTRGVLFYNPRSYPNADAGRDNRYVYVFKTYKYSQVELARFNSSRRFILTANNVEY